MSWLKSSQSLTSAASGWDGVWTLVGTAGRATADLAALPGVDDDLSLAYAALDLALAMTELDSTLGAGVGGPVVDLGPPPEARADYVGVVDAILATAAQAIHDLVSAEGADAAAVRCGTRVLLLVESARSKVTGGAW